jgi:hypothetical protein
MMEDNRPAIRRFDLRRNAFEQLVLVDDEGREYEGVEPVRAFPLSDPRRAISLCGPDGQEIAYIDCLDDLAPELRKIVEAELSQREFVPHIVKVVNTPSETEPAEWQVLTDRGLTTFQLESEDAVHRQEPSQVTIVDSRGIRYLVPDARKLDAHSRRVLDRFL